MSEIPYHRSLRLENFTVFADASFEFSPGVNAFIGENGAGKTHLLKAMYAFQRPPSRDVSTVESALCQLFQTKNLSDLIRERMLQGSGVEVGGVFGLAPWAYRIWRKGSGAGFDSSGRYDLPRPVFIPAMDMMGHAYQFSQAYNQVFIDFDLTCYDIVSLFTLVKKTSIATPEVDSTLAPLLGGELEFEEGRFYVHTQDGRQAMPMVAEGIRKIATLLRLHRNGWLEPGTTLYWDEPEANLNPVLMDRVASAILTLARSGVQVFLATHSYVMIREIDVQSRKSDAVRFLALTRNEDGVTVNAAASYLEIEPNPIERQYASLYDRAIEKRLAGGVG